MKKMRIISVLLTLFLLAGVLPMAAPSAIPSAAALETVTTPVSLYGWEHFDPSEWEYNEYAVVFNGNGGNVNDTHGDRIIYGCFYGDILGEHKYNLNPNRTGYTFIGWFTEKSCTNEWDFENGKVTNDLFLYAGWQKNNSKEATVTFMGAGTVKNTTIKATIGKKISKPTNPTRTGYTFKGWYKDSKFKTKWDFSKDVITKAKTTIYSKWQIKTYTLKYNTNGGTKIPSIKLKYGQYVPEPSTTPTKKGKVFYNWYYDKNFTCKIIGMDVDRNMTAYAKWVDAVALKLDANGGKINSASTQTLTVGKGMTVQTQKPTRSGYEFTGWYKEKACKTRLSTYEVYLTGFKGTVYAGWVKTYTFKVELNGGTGSYKTLTVRSGNTVTISSNPTRSGYTFGGWYSDKALKTVWKSGSKITKDTTVYAKWVVIPAVSIYKKASYSKTYNYNGANRDILHMKVTLQFNKAGTYIIEQDFRSGSDRKLYKSYKKTMSANKTLTLTQDFVLSYNKVGECKYYIRVKDSSGKTVFEKGYTCPWHLGDIGTDMSVQG